jgi:hypothetical protein
LGLSVRGKASDSGERGSRGLTATAGKTDQSDETDQGPFFYNKNSFSSVLICLIGFPAVAVNPRNPRSPLLPAQKRSMDKHLM